MRPCAREVGGGWSFSEGSSLTLERFFQAQTQEVSYGICTQWIRWCTRGTFDPFPLLLSHSAFSLPAWERLTTKIEMFMTAAIKWFFTGNSNTQTYHHRNAVTCATLSSQVSRVSHAIFKSDSLNSYFLAQPRGE